MAPDFSNSNELQDFGNLELLSQQVVEGFITGLHKSPFHGFSVEFAEHKLYNPGDSVKNVDWKLFGRTDKLFVKRFEEETNLRCQIVLDVSSSMYYPEKMFNKLLFSVYASASLMYLLKKQRDAFGLSFFSEQLELTTAAKSTTAHQKYLFSELEKLMNRNVNGCRTDVASALHQIAEQIHKRSLVIIFSDMLDGESDDGLNKIFAALQHLKHNKHEIILFNVLDHKMELAFEFENRPHNFIDIESGEEIKLHPNNVRASYLEAINLYHKELKLKCAQYKIDFIDADIHSGFYQILHSYLLKRAKMG
ncbi:DUF58 domain-containing protein [Daejeonella sp.]|jgi:uncharacterized protein (DUF58 family)|uniref:DUF58 domain-containing protein n=1 Tax=Daejeonella sp. TaxID=2805397 RepID=UPI003784254B